MRFGEIYEAVGYSDLEVNEENLEKYKTQIKSYFENKQYIFRGMKETSPVIYADGALLNRQSKNADNTYTMAMSIIPSWKGWPPRHKSFICSSSEHGASAYGRTYLAIPLENQAIAVVPSHDFWQHIDFSDHGLKIYDLPDFNGYFSFIAYKLFKLDDPEYRFTVPTTGQEMETLLHAMDEKLKIVGSESFKDPSTRELAEFFKENGGTKNALNKLFDPVTNGCKLFPHFSDYIMLDKTRELWFTGKVLFVSAFDADVLDKFMALAGMTVADFYN